MFPKDFRHPIIFHKNSKYNYRWYHLKICRAKFKSDIPNKQQESAPEKNLNNKHTIVTPLFKGHWKGSYDFPFTPFEQVRVAMNRHFVLAIVKRRDAKQLDNKLQQMSRPKAPTLLLTVVLLIIFDKKLTCKDPTPQIISESDLECHSVLSVRN